MIDQIKRFVELTKTKRQLEAEVKLINADLKKLQDPVLEYFHEQGIQSTSIDGMSVFISSKLYAKRCPDVSLDDAIHALQEARLDSFTAPAINTQGLSKYFREAEEIGEEVPSCLEGKIDVNRYYEVVARKS